MQTESRKFPALAPEWYIAAPGDTFEKIAEAVYNDGRVAAAIAKENGYNIDQTPQVGSRIKLPQTLISSNRYGTSPSYQKFLNALMDNLGPHLFAKIPKPKPVHHSFLNTLIEVVDCNQETKDHIGDNYTHKGSCGCR